MRKFLALAVMGLTFTGTAFADAIDDIEAAITPKWEKIASLSYDSEMTSKMDSDAFKSNMTSTGSTQMQRKGDKWNMRMDSKSDSSSTVQGKETKTSSITQMISSDGFIYTLSESEGKKTAMKMKAPDSKDSGGKAFFKSIRESNNLKVLPDETVDGQACYALEATPKNSPAGVQPTTTKYCFSKTTGMMVQTTSTSADGKNVSKMTVKNVKVDPSIPADRFVFTPPAGVEVQDMSDMEAMVKRMQEKAAADAAAAQKKAEEDAKAEANKEEAKPAAEPAKEEPKKEEKKKDEKPKSKLKGFGL